MATLWNSAGKTLEKGRTITVKELLEEPKKKDLNTMRRTLARRHNLNL